MTLTNRVSLFFLGALALVLIVYSTLVYGMTRSHLLRQSDQDLKQTFNTLIAAVDVDEKDVEWGPSDVQRVAINDVEAEHEAYWVVHDARGRIIDQSPILPTPFLKSQPQFDRPEGLRAELLEPRQEGSYRVLQHTLRASQPDTEVHDPDEYEALTITVAVNSAQAQATLRWLAVLLGLLSFGGWLIAAVVGRWYTRRALRPVDRMAEDAHAIQTADFSRRLALPGTRDEIENVARAFNDLLHRLQEAFEREQRFTADAAHQLRTPVTVLLGQIEVARRRTRSVEEYQRTLDVLQQQAAGLRELIESLMFLARAGKDAEAPQLEQVDLRRWLPEQLESWSHHARAADLQLVGAEGEPLPARISPTLLAQLVNNFVDNGFKYSRSGSLVTVSLERADESAVLAVTDQGMGMTAEEVAHVFDPFYRSPASRQAGISGTGLGLAIAARIAEVLGMELRAASRKGQGSRFEIHIPLTGRPARGFSGVAAAGRP